MSEPADQMEMDNRPAAPRRRKLPDDIKAHIVSRQEDACALCACKFNARVQAHFDHVIPWSIHPCDDPDNIQALCPNCHDSKTRAENTEIAKFKKAAAGRLTRMCWTCKRIVSPFFLRTHFSCYDCSTARAAMLLTQSVTAYQRQLIAKSLGM